MRSVVQLPLKRAIEGERVSAFWQPRHLPVAQLDDGLSSYEPV